MADKKNLCAQIDIALHNRVTEEKDRLEMTTSQYIAALLTEYYKMKDENGGINMTGSRTMAFQIPEELFQRIKTHLARETARTGVKLTQRDFVLGLIEQALAAVGASYALTNIFICVAIGGGIGASVIVSRYFGAGEYGRMKLAVYGGAVLMVGGILLVAAVLVSSISTMRLKPKQILSQME